LRKNGDDGEIGERVTSFLSHLYLVKSANRAVRVAGQVEAAEGVAVKWKRRDGIG